MLKNIYDQYFQTILYVFFLRKKFLQIITTPVLRQ